MTWCREIGSNLLRSLLFLRKSQILFISLSFEIKMKFLISKRCGCIFLTVFISLSVMTWCREIGSNLLRSLLFLRKSQILFISLSFEIKMKFLISKRCGCIFLTVFIFLSVMTGCRKIGINLLRSLLFLRKSQILFISLSFEIKMKFLISKRCG